MTTHSPGSLRRLLRRWPTKGRPASRARGQALVEFSFVLIFGLLAMLMLIDIGRVFNEYVAMRGGQLMGAAYMQDYVKFTGYTTCASGTALNTPVSGTDRCKKVWQIMQDASGLSDARSTDFYGDTLPSAEKETITFTQTSGTLWSSCGQYKITWARPFLPVAPYARTLLGLTGTSLVMTAVIEGQHNHSTPGTRC